MTLTFTVNDLLYFIVGIFVGYLIPHGRRYFGRRWGSYRRRRYF